MVELPDHPKLFKLVSAVRRACPLGESHEFAPENESLFF
jgi:hypothetical protein